MRWAFARAVVCCLRALLVLLALRSVLSVSHPLSSMAALGWPFALCTFIFILRLRAEQRHTLVDTAHLLTFWLASALMSWEFVWQYGQWMPAVERWTEATALLIPSVSIAAVLCAQRHEYWPLVARQGLYLCLGVMPLVVVMAIALFALTVRGPGANWPIVYLPLLNPMDLLGVLALTVMVMWWCARGEFGTARMHGVLAIAGLALSFA